MAPPCPILARYRLVAPGSCACFPFKFVQESACCLCVCRNLETLRLRFLTFHAGFSFGLSLQSEAGPCMIIGFIFLWPIFGFLYYLVRWLVIPAVMTQSCWTPFWAGRFIPFLSGLSQALFCFFFYSWAPMSLGFLFPFGHPQPVC